MTTMLKGKMSINPAMIYAHLSTIEAARDTWPRLFEYEIPVMRCQLRFTIEPKWTWTAVTRTPRKLVNYKLCPYAGKYADCAQAANTRCLSLVPGGEGERYSNYSMMLYSNVACAAERRDYMQQYNCSADTRCMTAWL